MQDLIWIANHLYINKYKNQLNKLWNEVGMEVPKSNRTRWSGRDDTHPELHLFLSSHGLHDRCVLVVVIPARSSCSITFWYLHPYFIPQFIQLIFILVCVFFCMITNHMRLPSAALQTLFACSRSVRNAKTLRACYGRGYVYYIDCCDRVVQVLRVAESSW